MSVQIENSRKGALEPLKEIELPKIFLQNIVPLSALIRSGGILYLYSSTYQDID